MKLGSLLFRHIGGLILAVAAAHSWANPVGLVELSGLAGFSCASGTGGFEKDCANGDNIEFGPFNLIYDPSVPDTDPNQDRGFFKNAIRSFSMTLSQNHRPDLVFSLVGQGDFIRSINSQNEARLTWAMVLKEKNNVIPHSLFTFGWQDPLIRNPNEMPGTDFWFTSIPLDAGTTGVSESDWVYSSGSLSVRTVPRPLPAPPSSWLLVIGAAGALFQRWRSRDSRLA